jgi:hypothetical protein
MLNALHDLESVKEDLDYLLENSNMVLRAFFVVLFPGEGVGQMRNWITSIHIAIILSKELAHSLPHIFTIKFSNIIYTYNFQSLYDAGKLADPSVLLHVHYIGTTVSYNSPQN